jgi:hypothetical protein
MNRFNRDYALVRIADGRIIAESHDLARLESMRQDLAMEGVKAQIIKSDLPRAQEPTFVDTCIETAYGSTTRLSFQVRVF